MWPGTVDFLCDTSPPGAGETGDQLWPVITVSWPGSPAGERVSTSTHQHGVHSVFVFLRLVMEQFEGLESENWNCDKQNK